MSIYVRTSAGNAEIASPTPTLPRKLRTLLIAIDGRTPASIYVQTLVSFGDVKALMGLLVDRGLVIEAPESPDDSRPSAAMSAGANWPVPQGGVQAPMAASSAVAAGSREQASATRRDDDYALRKAVALMSDFLAEHLPMDSMEITLALEKIESLDQLMANLPDYQRIARRAGDPARRHLSELQAALAAADPSL